jgi:hypothetical protein
MAKKTYKVKTHFIFEGEFEVNADNKPQAKEYVEKHCGLIMGGGIHTSLGTDVVLNWEFLTHGDKKIISIVKA